MSWKIDEYFYLYYKGRSSANIYETLKSNEWIYNNYDNKKWKVKDKHIKTKEIVKLVNVKHKIINPKTYNLIEGELKLYKSGMIDSEFIILHKGYLLFKYRPTPELQNYMYHIRLIKIDKIKECLEWFRIECNNYKEEKKIYIIPNDQCTILLKYLNDKLTIKITSIGYYKQNINVIGIDAMIDKYNSLKNFEFGKILIGQLLNLRLGKDMTHNIMSYLVGDDIMNLEREEYGGQPLDIFIVKNPTKKIRKRNYAKISGYIIGLIAIGVGIKRFYL